MSYLSSEVPSALTEFSTSPRENKFCENKKNQEEEWLRKRWDEIPRDIEAILQIIFPEKN